jgi:hypothetical protein
VLVHLLGDVRRGPHALRPGNHRAAAKEQTQKQKKQKKKHEFERQTQRATTCASSPTLQVRRGVRGVGVDSAREWTRRVTFGSILPSESAPLGSFTGGSTGKGGLTCVPAMSSRVTKYAPARASSFIQVSHKIISWLAFTATPPTVQIASKKLMSRV